MNLNEGFDKQAVDSTLVATIANTQSRVNYKKLQITDNKSKNLH